MVKERADRVLRNESSDKECVTVTLCSDPLGVDG